MSKFLKAFFILIFAFANILTPFEVSADIQTLTAKQTFNLTGTLIISPLSGQTVCASTVTGTWTGSISFQGTNDLPSGYTTIGSPTTVNGVFYTSVAGLTSFQANVTTLSSGSVTIAESCTGGSVGGGGSSTVTVANFPATQPVSLATTIPVNVTNVLPTPIPTATPGQNTMANSQSVTIASNQSVVPVSTPAPGPTNAAGTAYRFQGVDGLNSNIASVEVCIPNGITCGPQGATAGSFAMTPTNNAFATTTITGNNMVTWNIVGLTGTGATVAFQASNNAGSTYTNSPAVSSNAPTIPMVSTTVDGLYYQTTPNATNARLIATVACTGGTCAASTVDWQASPGVLTFSGNATYATITDGRVSSAVGNSEVTAMMYGINGAANNAASPNGNEDRIHMDSNTSGVVRVNVGASTEVSLSAALNTCTTITSASTIGTRLVNINYASSAAQTGTLTIYNEGASPTCTAADAIYVSATHVATGIPDVPNFWATAGLAYKWTTAVAAGVVWAGYN